MQGKERRRFVRLDAYHLARYRLAQDPARANVFTNAKVMNVSAGGCCLLSEESLPSATIIEIQINFPRIAQTLSTLARVVWRKHIAKADLYKYGIEFIQIPDELRHAIDEQIKSVYDELDRQRSFISKFFIKGGGKMPKSLGKALLILAVLFVILAAGIKMTTLGTIMPGAMPINWVKLADTVLLFSIAVSLLGKQ